MPLTQAQLKRQESNKRYYENRKKQRNSPTTPPASVPNSPTTSPTPTATPTTKSLQENLLVDIIKMLQQERDEYKRQVDTYKGLLQPLLTELKK